LSNGRVPLGEAGSVPPPCCWFDNAQRAGEGRDGGADVGYHIDLGDAGGIGALLESVKHF
jgi:hypothetical protein